VEAASCGCPPGSAPQLADGIRIDLRASGTAVETSEQLPREALEVRVAVTDGLLMRTDGAVCRLQQEHGKVRFLRHGPERAVVLQVRQTVRVLLRRHGRWIASRHSIRILRRDLVDPSAIRLNGSGETDGMPHDDIAERLHVARWQFDIQRFRFTAHAPLPGLSPIPERRPHVSQPLQGKQVGSQRYDDMIAGDQGGAKLG